jgi:2-keto-4-pentenoate hydratase/2-oxohepta-3-ene-1,7-dioic acid hydratase in catechol pathway
LLDGDTVRELDGDLFDDPRETGVATPLSDVRLLAPCAPSKVIAVGLNYQSHLKGRPRPEYPGLFAKLPSAIIGPEDEIVIPPDAREQKGDLQWLRAKASDTFGPLGPAIATGLDHNDLLVQSRLNGEVRQSERSADLIFDVETLVSFASRYVTLEPGDVIFTGTPGSTSAMQNGDVVEVEIEGVGILRNSVVRAET